MHDVDVCLLSIRMKTSPHRFHVGHQTVIKEKENAHFLLKFPELQWKKCNGSTPY